MILTLAEFYSPALATVYLLGVHNWQADFLTWQLRDPGEGL